MANKDLFPGLTDYKDAIVNPEMETSAIVSHVQTKFELAARLRQPVELRWARAFDQFRGNYSPEELSALAAIRAINPRASEAFIKVTKTKTLAAFGSLVEVLAANGQIPIAVEETPEPEGIAKEVYKAPLDAGKDIFAAIGEEIGYKGDGKDLKAGTTFQDIFGGLTKKFDKLFEGGLAVVGKSPDPQAMPSVHPAREAAERMNAVIHDQLLEIDALSQLQGCIWELSVFGTGVVKGPFTSKQFSPRWEYDKEVDDKPVLIPQEKLRPVIENPSVWDIYPDPYARTQEELDFVIEKHLLTREQLSGLKRQPLFDKAAINKVISRQGKGAIKTHGYEQKLADAVAQGDDTRYEVLEFWGNLDVIKAKEWRIKDIPSGLDDYDQLSVRIWIVDNECILKQINPFTPERIPYYFPVYEENKYSIWGIGVPENMEDSQRMINVHTRAAQDNLRLAGSLMLEVNETQLAPGQDGNIYDGKVWRKQGGAPGQSIYPISFKSTANEHLQFIQAANQWADTATGIPSILHGQGTGGVGRTAFGLNALMNSGLLAIRTVIKNIDRKLLKPLGQAMFDWNMQFNTDVPEIRGDLRIVAKGTALLAMKEIQSQRLLSLLQISANPLVAPYVNVPNVLHDLALSLDLNPTDIINDQNQAALAAQIIGTQNAKFNDGTQAPQTPTPGGVPSSGGVPSGQEAGYNQGGDGSNYGSAVGRGSGAAVSIAGA